MEEPTYIDPHAVPGFNELHSYCWQCGPSGVRTCLRNGFDPNAEDEWGWTPIFWLVRMRDRHNRSRQKLFRWLIEAGANVHHRDKEGQNILQLAKGCCSKTFYRFVRREYTRLTRAIPAASGTGRVPARRKS